MAYGKITLSERIAGVARHAKQLQNRGAVLIICGLLTPLALICSPAFANGPYGNRFVGTSWSGFDSPLFGTLFTQVTPEYAGYWGFVEHREDQFNWGPLDAMYKLAARKHLIVEQHNMIWGQHRWPSIMTPWVTKRNAASAVRNWFAAYAARYRGKFQLIDVVNEPLHNPPAYRVALPGGNTRWGWIIWAYRLARKDFPSARLLINEYNILNNPKTTRRYIRLIRLLEARHLIDGVGCQAHFLEHTKTSIIRADLQRLNRLNLPIYISEFDLNWKSNKKQLQQMKTQFPIFWNDPHVAGITFWDFKQGHTWLPHTYLVLHNGNQRPALVWLKKYLARNPTPRKPVDWLKAYLADHPR
jgi:endo-1,4-beta-xylanase